MLPPRISIPQVIICDLGRVLVDFRDIYDNEKFTRLCRAPKDDVRKFFRTGELGDDFARYEKGLVTREEFFALVQNGLGFTGSYEEFVTLFGDMSFEVKRDVYDLLFGKQVKLRYGPEFWMLSNLNELHYEVINSKCPGVFANCRRLFLSFETHTRKPEMKAFDFMFNSLNLTQVNPAVCLFLDDMEENCAAAEKRKPRIPSACVKNAEDIKRVLVQCGMELD